MKTIILTFLVGFALTQSVSQAAETGTLCHALDFDSYFVAQNVKDNIKRLNPEVAHPNFANNYLLLRAELSMETLYLIAACETGKFFHEKISADQAFFSADSHQVQFKQLNGETTPYEWDGKSWIKGEQTEAGRVEPPKPSHDSRPGDQKAASGPAVVTPSLIHAYESVFAKHLVESKPDLKCAKLDFSSYFRAQENQGAIRNSAADYTHANFGGTLLLVKTDSLFDEVYLIADCQSGKFFNETIKGHINFKPNSNLVVNKSTSEHPELALWANEQWIRIPNPVLTKPEVLKNTLTGDFAKRLTTSLPNSKHLDTLRFEKLAATPDTQAIFDTLNVQTIDSGVCRIPQGKKPSCDLLTGP